MTAVPERLYKYQSRSMSSITNLSAGKIWFSDPTRFNDPFDCALRIRGSELGFQTYQSIEEKLLAASEITQGDLQAILAVPIEDRYKLAAPVLRKKIEEGLDYIQGVSCFSATPYSLLMWGHYGDGHRGFCLEFETNKDQSLFSRAKPVTYSKNRVHLEIDRIAKGDLQHMLDAVLVKAECWKYEEEWRVLYGKKDALYSYNRASLSKVYCGAKMPEDQRLQIARLLHGTSTKLCRMHMDEFSFELNAEEVPFTPMDYPIKEAE